MAATQRSSTSPMTTLSQSIGIRANAEKNGIGVTYDVVTDYGELMQLVGAGQ